MEALIGHEMQMFTRRISKQHAMRDRLVKLDAYVAALQERGHFGGGLLELPSDPVAGNFDRGKCSGGFVGEAVQFDQGCITAFKIQQDAVVIEPC